MTIINKCQMNSWMRRYVYWHKDKEIVMCTLTIEVLIWAEIQLWSETNSYWYRVYTSKILLTYDWLLFKVASSLHILKINSMYVFSWGIIFWILHINLYLLNLKSFVTLMSSNTLNFGWTCRQISRDFQKNSV